MATATETQQRAARSLDTIDLMVGDLAEVAADWDQMSEGERVAWTVDWSNEMSALERVAREAKAGLLGDGLKRRYQRVASEVKGACEVVDRLGLYQPALV